MVTLQYSTSTCVALGGDFKLDLKNDDLDTFLEHCQKRPESKVLKMFTQTLDDLIEEKE